MTLNDFLRHGTSLDGSVTGDIKGNKLSLTVTRRTLRQKLVCKIVMPGDREHFGFVNGHIQI